MHAIRIFAVLLGVVALLAAEAPKAAKPKLSLGKDTTYLTEPLDADGYVDYEAAINARLNGKTTPKTNAVVLLAKCFGPKPGGKQLPPDYFDYLGIDPPPVEGEYFVSSFEFFREEWRGDKTQEFLKLDSRLRDGPWKEADSPKHAEWIKLNEKPLAMATEASLRKDWYHPLACRNRDGTRGNLMGPETGALSAIRDAVHCLQIRATYRLGDGDVDGAFADVLTIHRLGQKVAAGSTLFELLCGLANREVARGTETAIFEYGRPSAKQSAAYSAAVRRIPEMPSVIQTSHYNRFVFLDAVAWMSRGKLIDDWGIPEFEDKKPEQILDMLDLDEILRIGNRWFDKLDTALALPEREAKLAALAKVNDELERTLKGFKGLPPLGEVENFRAAASERIGLGLAHMLLPAYGRMIISCSRGTQYLRHGQIAAALAAYRDERRKYPEVIEALVPRYLDAVPLDEFSGKPVIYRKTDAGYILYSVGENGKDDGGRFRIDEPPGDDIGFRIPRK